MTSIGARTAGHRPAPPVVLEAPESFALLLYSCQYVGDTAGVDKLRAALIAAAEGSAAAFGRHYPVTSVEAHDYVAGHPDMPQPHAHITVRGRVDFGAYEGWARYAQARYSADLQVRLLDLGIGVTRDYPTPHGWEITAAIPQLGHLQRHRCGTGLYPVEVELAAAAERRSAAS
jgi:hypothetical protein